MKSIFYLIMFCILGFCACNSPKEKSLTPEELDLLIQDLYIAEAALAKAHTLVRDSLIGVYKNQILKIHNLTENELEEVVKLRSDELNIYYKLNENVIKALKDKTD